MTFAYFRTRLFEFYPTSTIIRVIDGEIVPSETAGLGPAKLLGFSRWMAGHMRVGFVSFDRLEYAASIEAAASLGFDYLELMLDGDTHRTVLVDELDSLGDSLADYDLALLVHFPYPLLIGSPHPEQRRGAVRELKRCIDLAANIGAEKGVVHPDAFGWDRVWDDDEQERLVAESVAELDEYARASGVEICVENLFRRGSLDIHQLEAVIEQTESSLTFDTGHAALAGLDAAGMADFLADHRNRVSHLHLNDNRHSDPAYRGADEHLPLGYGTIDFETVLEPLLDGPWTGTMSIELDTANLDALQTSRNHLENIID